MPTNPEIHKCSPCMGEFSTEAEYLAHSCEAADGALPGTPEFLTKTTTPGYARISAAAVARGEEKKPE